MTTKNAARTAALIAVPTPPKPEAAKEAPAGWDPFEVWRTRVLMPRQGAHVAETERIPSIAKGTKR